MQSLKGEDGGRFMYHHYNDDGLRVWRITGEEPTFNKNDDILISNPHLIYFSQSGNTHINALSALFRVSGNSIHMEGNVMASNIKDFALSSQQAEFFMQEKKIRFPKQFKAKHEMTYLDCSKGEYFIEDSTFFASGNSQLIYYP
ncbi:MAG: LPS export ABC transporter periplasmic protein LptC [Planctomycetes bacterium]|nr:LPS export ABC transporter periplasmic protein LptC [Planctomycetota bacterium]